MTRRRSDALLAAALVTILASAALLRNTGEGLALPGGRRLGTICLTRMLTGWSCPFCGMSRGFVALLHGDIALSLACHPAGLLFAAWTAMVLAWIGVAQLGRAEPVAHRPAFWRSLACLALLALVVGATRTVVEAIAL